MDTREIPVTPIPRAIRHALLRGTPRVLVGWLWIIGVMLLGTHYGIVHHNELWVDLAFRGEVVITQGMVDASDKAPHNWTASRSNSSPLGQYRFMYATREDIQRYGISYHDRTDPLPSVSLQVMDLDYPEANPVSIEYPAKAPAFARIRGMRYHPWHTRDLVHLLLMAWVPGLLWSINHLRRRRAELQRIEGSVLVSANLQECLPVMFLVPNGEYQTYYQGTFVFHDRQGHPHTVEGRNTERPWTEKDSVLVLYNADHPESAQIFENRLVTRYYTLDSDGKMTPTVWTRGSLLLPISALAVTVFVLLSALGQHIILGM